MNWKSINIPKSESFLSETGDASLLIVKSGWLDQYHAIEESVVDGKIDHDDLFTKEQLKQKFNIEISI